MMGFSESELRQVTKMVWGTQLGLELQDATQALGNPSGEINGAHITASIQITGDWKGAVLLSSSQQLARRAAALMFGLEEQELAEDDTPDAFGEIANMTAGNLISLLPGRTPISLPIVVEGSNHHLKLLDSDPLLSTGFSYDGEPLVVTVLVGHPHEA